MVVSGPCNILSAPLLYSQQRRTASQQTTEDCLTANNGGLPHNKQRRTASMRTAEDCPKAVSGGLPHSTRRRTASQQTAEDCLKADSTLLRYSETFSFLLGFVRRLLVIKTFRKAAVLPSTGSRYEPLCCTPYKYRLSVPEADCRNNVLISRIRTRRTKR